MDITITINTDNAAFYKDYCRFEVARILKKIATKIEMDGVEEMPCMDVTGNKVGCLRIEDDDPIQIPLDLDRDPR